MTTLTLIVAALMVLMVLMVYVFAIRAIFHHARRPPHGAVQHRRPRHYHWRT
ncbi:hypothetical protein P3W85_08100 [Cupriavidus basilensis]|uniref:Uncharacterized protein n=1 Tax=Cupriavidus basilensis TaxID=68895 RepID=A0ABT6AJY5_9BURK|nr:hypothetical protein [Cupriavidus basilensis]MDF3832908.1 hypothetical protein [Cupriavidus basilensis]